MADNHLNLDDLDKVTGGNGYYDVHLIICESCGSRFFKGEYECPCCGATNTRRYEDGTEN